MCNLYRQLEITLLSKSSPQAVPANRSLDFTRSVCTRVAVGLGYPIPLDGMRLSSHGMGRYGKDELLNVTVDHVDLDD